MEEEYYMKYLKYKRKYLKLKYGGDGSVPTPLNPYNQPLSDLKDNIIKFMTELDCCEKELKTQSEENISDKKKKKVLQVLSKNYAKMASQIKKVVSIDNIKKIDNNVIPDKVETLIGYSYGPSIREIFNGYRMFLKDLLDDLKREKVALNLSFIPKCCQILDIQKLELIRTSIDSLLQEVEKSPALYAVSLKRSLSASEKGLASQLKEMKDTKKLIEKVK
jgi:hypothetical protein